MMLFYHIKQIVQFIFDPTPRAIKHVKYVKGVLDDKAIPVDDKNLVGDNNYWNMILSHKVKINLILCGTD